MMFHTRIRGRCEAGAGFFGYHPTSIKGIILILIGELLTFGVFEFFYRKRHLLEKKVVVPLPDILEPDFGDVCSLCRKNVGRGNLKEFENKWICNECYETQQKGQGEV